MTRMFDFRGNLNRTPELIQLSQGNPGPSEYTNIQEDLYDIVENTKISQRSWSANVENMMRTIIWKTLPE